MAEMSYSPKHSPGKKRKTKTKWRPLPQTEFSGPPVTKPPSKPDTETVKPPAQVATSLTRNAWGSGQVPNTILANSSSSQQNTGASESWPVLGTPSMNKCQSLDNTPSVQVDCSEPAKIDGNGENMAQDENMVQNEALPVNNTDGHSPDTAVAASTISDESTSKKVEWRQPNYDSENASSTEHVTFRAQFTSSLPPASLFKLSKTLSYILRHGAGNLGLEFLPGGFLYVDDLLKLQQLKHYTLNNIIEVVETNDKKRFHIDRDGEDGEDGKLKIRANQGHSVAVEGLELTEITDPSRYPDVVHGTFMKHWESINTQGLKRMGRTHIHFAPGEPGKDKVISGMKNTCDLMIFIDLALALNDGLKFFLSANRVILSPGDEDGSISAKYFQKVINRRTRAPVPW